MATPTAKQRAASARAKKAWETIRRNKAKATRSSAPRMNTKRKVMAALTKARKAEAESMRTISLAGTRKLRASVPTLVTRLGDAKSVEYYYGEKRSVIVVNN